MTHAQLVALCVIATLACYDSRWGDAKRAQQSASRASTPSQIHASTGGEHAPAKATTFRVRVFASPAYGAQMVDWQRQARDLVDDANEIVEPSLGAHLAIDRLDGWEPSDEEDLQKTLDALCQAEGGEGVDWVLGLVGGLPRTTVSFHDVGRATVLGRHMVMRAPARQGEHDAIEKAFDELSEEERARLRRDRKRHRALAVFLHELGHTLGAPHERDA
jgi:hypothetical protein